MRLLIIYSVLWMFHILTVEQCVRGFKYSFIAKRNKKDALQCDEQFSGHTRTLVKL